MRRERLVLSLALLTAVAHVWAGEFNVVGNMNVASNLTAKTIDVGGDGMYSLSRYDMCGESVAIRRSGAQSLLAMTLFDYWTDAAVISCYSTNGWCSGRPLAINPDGGAVTVFGMGGDDGVFTVKGDTTIEGKLTLRDGMDPPYLLLDSETRAGIARRVAREVPPSKRCGAALFWNNQTKRLEIYVASEGSFYNLAGNLITNITPPAIAGAVVSRHLTIDSETGNILTNETQRVPRWRLKRGYRFDRVTGQFTYQAGTNAAPVAVSREEALELR